VTRGFNSEHHKTVNSLEILFLRAGVGASIRTMPSEIAERDRESSAVYSPATEVLTSAQRAAGAKILHGPDPSIHLLGMPESHPHLGRWVALAILMGAIAAFTLVGILVR
jgi:hypothetical protein